MTHAAHDISVTQPGLVPTKSPHRPSKVGSRPHARSSPCAVCTRARDEGRSRPPLTSTRDLSKQVDAWAVAGGGHTPQPAAPRPHALPPSPAHAPTVRLRLNAAGGLPARIQCVPERRRGSPGQPCRLLAETERVRVRCTCGTVAWHAHVMTSEVESRSGTCEPWLEGRKALALLTRRLQINSSQLKSSSQVKSSCVT